MSQRLRSTFRFGLALFLLVGCEGSEPATDTSAPGERDPRSDAELPVAAFCGAGESTGYDAITKAIFDGLAPEPPAAYQSLRKNAGELPGGLTEELVLVAERGQLCGDASDVAACKAAYEALQPPISPSMHHCFTRGDVAACVEDAEDARSLLGGVHSLEEAFYVAGYAGYSVSCSSSYVVARGKALRDGSFRLVVAKSVPGGPCGQLHRAVVDVASDGSVTELETALANDSPTCP